MLNKLKLNQLYFKDTQFVNLMTKRIFNVLLVANPYDAFMLEDDGRIDEKIFIEYTSLSLRYPPRFTQVSTEEDAWKQLENTRFELVICMPGTDNSDTFDIARPFGGAYSFLARHTGTHGTRRLEYFRICVLLVREYRPVGVYHQADRRQNEPGARHQGSGRANDSFGGRFYPVLFFCIAEPV